MVTLRSVPTAHVSGLLALYSAATTTAPWYVLRGYADRRVDTLSVLSVGGYRWLCAAAPALAIASLAVSLARNGYRLRLALNVGICAMVFTVGVDACAILSNPFAGHGGLVQTGMGWGAWGAIVLSVLGGATMASTRVWLSVDGARSNPRES